VLLGRAEYENRVKALLEDPHILVVLEQKHVHYVAHEVLEHVHPFSVEICNALHKEGRFLGWFAAQLLMHELAEYVNAVGAIGLDFKLGR